ncbi:hypothetical protein GOBAR_DD04792 [Gossypium barbadense]|nr:hypothetical protein GOBAR_DD04792 [Gossypium barbadense]
MELVDDKDVKTMVALYYRNQSRQTYSIQLFAKLAEDFTPLDYSDPDLDEVPDDIDDKGANNNGNVNASLVENPSRGIIIRNDPGAHMSIVNPNVAHVSKFPEYPDILPAHRLSTDPEHSSIVSGTLQLTFTETTRMQTVYELESYIFRQRMTRLETDTQGETNTPFREWLSTMKPWQWAQSFNDGARYGHMTTNLAKMVNSVLRQT